MSSSVAQRPTSMNSRTNVMERAWEMSMSADASRSSFLFCDAPLRRRRGREAISLDSPGKQLCAEMPSPNGDTRAQVVVAYQGHPVFVCAQCATVIVCGLWISPNRLYANRVRSHRHSKTN